MWLWVYVREVDERIDMHSVIGQLTLTDIKEWTEKENQL